MDYNNLVKFEKCEYQPLEENEEIDMVFTYLNSSDKGYIEKLKYWVENEGKYVLPQKNSSFEDRYIEYNELFFSIMFIKKFLKFIRYIFIVTPTPNIIKKYYSDDDQIKIVEDKDILPDHVVDPCFKSTVIESYLHLIPDVSDTFLYGCDDMFIGNTMTKDDFISMNGVPNIYLENFKIDYDNPERYLGEAFRMDIINANLCINKKYGITPRLNHNHQITVYRKEVCLIAHKFFEEEIRKNGENRFRYPTNDNLHFALLQTFIGVLYGYYEKNITRRGEHTSIGFYPYNSHNPWKRFYRILKEKPKFFCLNFINKEYLHYYYHLFLNYNCSTIDEDKKFILISKENDIFLQNKHFRIKNFLLDYGNVYCGKITTLPRYLCNFNEENGEIIWNKNKKIKNKNMVVIYIWERQNALVKFRGNENYDIQTVNINYLVNIIPEISFFSQINSDEVIIKKDPAYYKQNYHNVLKDKHNIIFRKKKDNNFKTFTENYPSNILSKHQVYFPK